MARPVRAGIDHSFRPGNCRGEIPFANGLRSPRMARRWMFALDRPFEVPSGAILARGDYLWSVQTIRKARRYEVVSSLGAAGKALTPGERREALEVPPWISPAVRELAQSWATQSSTPRAVVNSALQFFRVERFSLFVVSRRIQKERPGTISLSSADWFLRALRCEFRYLDATGRNSCAGGRRISGR